MRNFTKLMLIGTMLFVCLGGAKAEDVKTLELKFTDPEFNVNYSPYQTTGNSVNATTGELSLGANASCAWDRYYSSPKFDLSNSDFFVVKLKDAATQDLIVLINQKGFWDTVGNDTENADHGIGYMGTLKAGDTELRIPLIRLKSNMTVHSGTTLDLSNIYMINLWTGGGGGECVYKIDEVYACLASVDGALVAEENFMKNASYSMWNEGFTTGEPPVPISGKSIGIVDKSLQVVNEDAVNNWECQYFVANNISLKKGANYVVRLGVEGTAAGSLTCVLGNWGSNKNTSNSFTTGAQIVDFTIKDFPATVSDAHIILQSGAFVGTLNITKAQVFELTAVDTYGDAIGSKDFTSAGDQSIYWKSDVAPAPTYSEENGLTITTEAAAANHWDYQYNIAQAATENGKDYIIHLNVKGTVSDKNIHWSFGNYPNTVSGSFKVTDAWNTIELMCAGVPYTGTSDLAIQTGDYVATLYVKDVTIYPAVEGRLVEVGEAGYSTFSANKAVKMRGVTAYGAKYDGSKIVLTPVTEIPANTGVIIEAAKDNYKVPVIESAASYNASVNDLRVSDGNTISDGTHYFALGKNDDKVGFMKVKNGVTIPKGKAYLYIAIPPKSRDFIGFDDETTGIESVKQQAKADNQYFNIAGQRVAQPTKGLYIVNGKKVIIK